MSFFLLAAACLIIKPLLTFVLSLLFSENKGKVQEVAVAEQRSEIYGEVWQRMSVFEHIEQGLNKNPDGPAVICMFQPADSLKDFISGDDGVGKQQNGDSQFCIGPVQSGDSMDEKVQQQQKNDPCLSNGPIQTTCLTLTYTQLHRTALKLAAGLLANGAQPNTTMVMIIPNGGEYTVLLWTCILLRITYVSLDPALLDISDFAALKHMLQTLKPQLVVAPDALSCTAVDIAMSELQLPQPIRLCLSHSRNFGWKSFADLAAAAVKFPVDETALVVAARHD
ncbi:hypothetical protein V491_00704, partial [Pseudogymnoascus sp. VKM F-3775]